MKTLIALFGIVRHGIDLAGCAAACGGRRHHQRRRQPAVFDVLTMRDRSGHRTIRRRRDHARAVCGPRRAARARRHRRRLHAGVDRGRIRTARTRPDGEGRRANGRDRAAAVRRPAARVASARHDRHEGPLGRAHRQGQRQLGRLEAGAELHRAGQHHGRPRSGGGGGRHVRIHGRHWRAARRAHDPRDGSRPEQGRRSPLRQSAVGGDQDRRSERSRPRRRSHRARDRSRRASPSRSAR